jgi:hypothetical protein
MQRRYQCHMCAADWQGRENTDCYTRSCPLRKPKAEAIAEDALGLVRRWAGEQQRGWGIYSLGLSTSNFVAAPTGSSTLRRRGLDCWPPVAITPTPELLTSQLRSAVGQYQGIDQPLQVNAAWWWAQVHEAEGCGGRW